MKRIVVLGSTNTDMVMTGRRIPVPGETVSGGRFMMNPGGKGANQAVAVARLSSKRGACTFIAKVGDDLFGRNAAAYKAKACAAKDEKSAKGVGKGIVLSVVCGVLMAFFYRFIARTMDMDFAAAAPKAGMMTPYSAFFVFALGIFVSNFVFNAIAMRRPVNGEPITEKEYFKGGFAIHLVGIFGGLIWGLGNGINLVAAGKAGAAISYGLGQGATLVSALWGILVWREFKGAPQKAAILNVSMFVLFLVGLGLIIAAGEK